MNSRITIVLSVISVLVVSSLCSVPLSFATSTVKVTGSFRSPQNCSPCQSFVYANGEIFGMGNVTNQLDQVTSETDIYVFSASSSALLATIPFDFPQYMLYDSVDKTVVVVGAYNSSDLTDIVAISTTTNHIMTNVTAPSAYSYIGGYSSQTDAIPNSAPIAYDPHNDMIYFGSTICGGGSAYGLCQIAVVNAKTLSFEKTISFASHVLEGEMWSIVYDSKNNELFASATDGYIDECECFGALVTISDSTNKILSIVSLGQTGAMPYILTLDTSNNLLYAEDVGSSNIDVFNASANGALVTTLGNPDCCLYYYGISPADYAIDGNLVSGMFYATGCYDVNNGVVNGGMGCTEGEDFLNGTYYTVSGTKMGSQISVLSGMTSPNCFSPFWSGISKLTYIDCGSKLYVFATPTGKLQTTLNVHGTIEVFNRGTNMLWVQSGTTVYEIGT